MRWGIAAGFEEDRSATAPTRIEIHNRARTHPTWVLFGKSPRTPETDLFAIGEDNEHRTLRGVRNERANRFECAGNADAVVARSRTARHAIPVSPQHGERRVCALATRYFYEDVVHLESASVPTASHESLNRRFKAHLAHALEQALLGSVVPRRTHGAGCSITYESHQFIACTVRTEAGRIDSAFWLGWCGLLSAPHDQ
jgi:hypothetical protein